MNKNLGFSSRYVLWLIAALSLGVILLTLTSSGRRADRAATTSEQHGDYSAKMTTYTVKVSGIGRQYVVYRPRSLDAEQPAPVVIMYHGGGGTAQHAIDETDWPAAAERYGFVAVFPEGIRQNMKSRASFSNNPQNWNDGSGRYYAGEVNADDIGFTRAMIDDLASKVKIDQHRIYVTGFSNGASMAFRVGVELSDRIAAIAPVAASGVRVSDVKARRAVPLVYIHGTADPRNPLEGGDVENDWVAGSVDSRPPLSETLVKWASVSGCEAKTIPLLDKGGVKEVVFKCPAGMAIHFYTVEGLGHVWPGGSTTLPERLVGKSSNSLQANDVIWSFFKEHPMP